MADKDIKIGIKTTADTSGAKAAEAALKGVQKAGDAAETSGFGRDTAAARRIAALEAAEATEAQSAAVEKLAEATKEAAEELPELTKASRAFEDAQYGIRGVLNNLPGLVMMLGGTAGIAGAASVAAVAISILAPKLKELFGDGETEEATRKFNELLSETSTRISGVVSAKAAAAQTAWLETLEEEEEGIRRNTEAVSANVAILEARRLKLLSMAEADAELRKAEIDANKDLSPEEKIREKAKIDEEIAAKQAEEQIEKVRQAAGSKETSAEDAEQAAERKRQDAKAILEDRERLEAERKSLRERISAEGRKTTSIPALEKAIKDAKFQAKNQGGMYGDYSITPDEQKKISALEDQLADARNAASRALEPKRQLSAVDAKLKESPDPGTLKKEVNAVEEAAAVARAKAEEAKAIAKEQEEGITSNYLTGRKTRATRTDIAAEAARKAKSKQDEAEASARREEKRREEERLHNAGRDLETDITGIGKDAAASTRGLGGSSDLAEGFERVSGKIARKGDAQGDKVNLAAFLEKVSMLVDAIPDSKSDSEDAEKLRQVERKLEKKIADLTKRVNKK